MEHWCAFFVSTYYRTEILDSFQNMLFLQISKLIAEEYKKREFAEPKYFNALDQMLADSDYVCGTEKFAKDLSIKGNSVFRYLMSDGHLLSDYLSHYHYLLFKLVFSQVLLQPPIIQGFLACMEWC